MKSYTLKETTLQLDISARRVRQLIGELGLERKYNDRRLVFSGNDIRAMKARNRKGGRPANGKIT